MLRIINYGSFTPLAVPGPHPGDVFNNDPLCTAESPQLSTLEDKIALSWAEHCGAGPWHIYFRLLN